MPKPKSGESKDSWMSRCISKLKEEGKPDDQRKAQCLSMWRRHKNGNSNSDSNSNSSGHSSHHSSGHKRLRKK